MDYLKQSTLFKIKKVLRYVSLYGISRTYMKILGQLHSRKQYETLPKKLVRPSGKAFVGLIGCGNFAFTTIGYFLRKRFGRVIASCMDIDINRAASMSFYYRIPNYTTCAADVINDDKVQMLYIASYHSSHAEYAIQALEKGKHVYIEKPHVVSVEQLVRLINTMETTKGKVFLGFNRLFSRFGEIIRNYLDKETGSGIYNWSVAGHYLESDHWYHQKEEGGRILGNMCHWTDFVLRLVPVAKAFPIKIIPARAEKSDSDVNVSFVFNDNTVAVISFSAKGHAFEGVRERFTAYKGNTMIAMDDFKTMEINVVNKKKNFVNFYRDHGHSRSIVKAAENVIGNLPYNREAAIAHIWNTGLLFLETNRAFELREEITIHSYENYKSRNKEFERNPEGKRQPVMSHVRIGEKIETSSSV